MQFERERAAERPGRIREKRRGIRGGFSRPLSRGGEEYPQVCADPSDSSTLRREVRAFERVHGEYPRAVLRLFALNRDQALIDVPSGITVQHADESLLSASEPHT